MEIEKLVPEIRELKEAREEEEHSRAGLRNRKQDGGMCLEPPPPPPAEGEELLEQLNDGSPTRVAAIGA